MQNEYWVYVIELDARRLFEAGRCPSPDTQAMYVGETAKTPEARFAQHKEGGQKAVGIVCEYGVRLRQGFTRGVGPFATRQEARREERRIGNRLNARKHYKVWGGQGKPFMQGKAGRRGSDLVSAAPTATARDRKVGK